MEGISGSPEVATVMLRRISNSAIFVGHMTLVGTVPKIGTTEAKPFPNPNVLLEMGNAAPLMGWGREIWVRKENFGPGHSLPFNERIRRSPLNNSLTPALSKEEGTRKRKYL